MRVNSLHSRANNVLYMLPTDYASSTPDYFPVPFRTACHQFEIVSRNLWLKIGSRIAVARILAASLRFDALFVYAILQFDFNCWNRRPENIVDLDFQLNPLSRIDRFMQLCWIGCYIRVLYNFDQSVIWYYIGFVSFLVLFAFCFSSFGSCVNLRQWGRTRATAINNKTHEFIRDKKMHRRTFKIATKRLICPFLRQLENRNLAAQRRRYTLFDRGRASAHAFERACVVCVCMYGYCTVVEKAKKSLTTGEVRPCVCQKEY